MNPKINYFLHSLVLLALSIVLPYKLVAAEITVTLPPLAGLVHMLEPNSKVSCLLPANADPHHFQLSPRQVEALQQSKLLVRSSQDDGHWPGLNGYIPSFDVWPREHGQYNHAWLNPLAVQQVLPKLAQQLQKLHPGNKQIIQQNLAKALNTTRQLWQLWQEKAQSIHLRTRGVMMQHPAWSNMFMALQIPIHNTLESEQHGHEHGPHKLETALQQLQQHPDTLLVADKSHSSRSLQWLQRHHPDTIIITLDALGGCGESWVSLMQRNLVLLRP